MTIFLDPDHVFDFCRRNWFSCIDGVPGMAIIQTFQCEASVSFSLFTKLAVLAFVILFVSGTVLIYLLEKDHLFQDSNMSVKWINSMFYSITTRNAGLQIHDLGDFQITTLIIFLY